MSTPEALGTTPPTPPGDRVRLAFRATRPAYIPTSLIPGLVGLAAAVAADGEGRWWAGALAIVALFCLHAGTNVINDVEDFDRGVDSFDKLNNSRVFTTGLMSVPDGRILARGLFAAGAVLGVVIAAFQGPAVLVLGIVGLLAGYCYSAGPAPAKYAGLGDVVIVPVMGPFITLGAYDAVTGDAFAAAPFWLGFGPGLLIAAVLGANNLSDIAGDGAAGVRTLAVRLGFSRARAGYLAVLLLAYLPPVAVWAAGLTGWPVLVPLLTLPLAVRLVGVARTDGEPRQAALESLVPRTAQLHLLFCLLLAAGVLADRLLA